MLTWKIDILHLPLKYSWAISRNTSDYKDNVLITVTDFTFEGLGEAAPNVRYGEFAADLHKLFLNLLPELPHTVVPITEYIQWLDTKKLPNSLRFALESAYVHFLCMRENVSVATYFSLPNSTKVKTSYTIPIVPIGEIHSFYNRLQLQRFAYLKVKIAQEGASEWLQQLSTITKQPVIIDANEAWQDPDQFLNLIKSLPDLNVCFVEQPFPSGCVEEYKYLKKWCAYPVFADESVTSDPDFQEIESCFHGVNMKLMKAGGYVNGIRILKVCKQIGLQTMIGCMVETSLAISSALHLTSLTKYTDLDSFLLLKEEPFKLVEENEGAVFLI